VIHVGLSVRDACPAELSKLCGVQETANEVIQLVREAGRKLAGRWPTLLGLVLAGFTAKLAIVKLGLLAGRLGWALGVLLLAFTAAAMLTAVILMFRAILPTRNGFQFTAVLAPFLVIYLAMGHFDGYLIPPALERPVTMDLAAASVLIVVIAARWLLPLWPVISQKPWAAWVWLGLDVCWMSLVAFTLTTHALWQWLAGLAAPVSWVFGAALAALVIPLAWMAVGGLALGLRPADAPRLVRQAGLPLILATCLIILLLNKIPLLLWEIERLGAGSRDPQTFWVPLTGLLGAVNSAVPMLLIVPLVAALLQRSGGDEAGIGGQRLMANDPYGHRLGVGGRDEEDSHLIGI
jgi:hypothetical protein